LEVTGTTPSRPQLSGGTTGPSRTEVLDAIARAHEELLEQDEAEAALRSSEEEIKGLKEALRTRTTIGQAVGLLMCESTITADAAFSRLVEMSSHTNVKLREVAAQLVEEANARATAKP
jgi:AmiR/NasT family two-component response regulator